jgi:hypothetical protein
MSRALTSFTCCVRAPREMSLAEAADALARLLGARAPTFIERSLANQDNDFLWRLRGRGLDLELRCDDWQPERVRRLFRVSCSRATAQGLQALLAPTGWQVQADAPPGLASADG